MRGGRFGTGMNMFMSVHRQTLEADHAARARERARAMEDAMRRFPLRQHPHQRAGLQVVMHNAVRQQGNAAVLAGQLRQHA